MKSSGVITMYNTRGFGFILTGRSQIFFHIGDWSSLDLPARGMVVSYEIGPSLNPRFKSQAVNVQSITEESAKAAAFGQAAQGSAL